MIQSGNPAHTEPHSLLRLSATFGQSVVILFSKLDLRRKQSVTNAIYSVFVCTRACVCAWRKEGGGGEIRFLSCSCTKDALRRCCPSRLQPGDKRARFFLLLLAAPIPAADVGTWTRNKVASASESRASTSKISR